jgi:hypothetical protein
VALAPRSVHSEPAVHARVHTPHRQDSFPQSASFVHWSSQCVLLSVPEFDDVLPQDAATSTAVSDVTNAAAARSTRFPAILAIVFMITPRESRRELRGEARQ